MDVDVLLDDDKDRRDDETRERESSASVEDFLIRVGLLDWGKAKGDELGYKCGMVTEWRVGTGRLCW